MADADSGMTSGDAASADDVRAAFISGHLTDDAPPAEDTADAAPVESSDSDDDLDDQDAELDAAGDEDDEEVAVEAAATDDDSDLDEDDEKPAAPDAETAKRLEQVRRTERRMREQLAKERESMARDLDRREAELKPKLEAAERFEKLKARGFTAAIEELAAEFGATEDDIDLASKRFFAMSKAGKSDPKWKAAVDAIEKERALENRIKAMEKTAAEEREARVKMERQAEAQRNVDAFVGKIEKLVTSSEKTPLAKHLLETAPEEARGQMFIVANRLAEQLGKLPDHKAVMLAFEKEQRAVLRRFGIDPKTFKPAAKSAAASSTTTSPPKAPATKATGKKPVPPQAPTEKTASTKTPSKAELKDEFLKLKMPGIFD